MPHTLRTDCCIQDISVVGINHHSMDDIVPKPTSSGLPRDTGVATAIDPSFRCGVENTGAMRIHDQRLNAQWVWHVATCALPLSPAIAACEYTTIGTCVQGTGTARIYCQRPDGFRRHSRAAFLPLLTAIHALEYLSICPGIDHGGVGGIYRKGENQPPRQASLGRQPGLPAVCTMIDSGISASIEALSSNRIRRGVGHG